jgi:hypothetical protein
LGVEAGVDGAAGVGEALEDDSLGFEASLDSAGFDSLEESDEDSDEDSELLEA